MKHSLVFLAGCLSSCFALLAQEPEAAPVPFLVPDSPPVAFTGVHWNDEWDGDSPLSAEGSWVPLARFETGQFVRLNLARQGKPEHPREFPELIFWVTPQGAIYLSGTEDVSKAPEVTPLDLILPEIDEAGHFTHPPTTSEETPVLASARGWRWTNAPWTTEVSTDDGTVVRYLSSHPGGHFTKMVWQRGVGLTEIAMGSGARQSGWSLHRTVEPVAKPTAPGDVASLFAALPEEFIPIGDALQGAAKASARAEIAALKAGGALPKLNARLDVDRANGWLSITSNTDGEGETLDVVLWKKKGGNPLLALLLQRWTAGPTESRALRVVELRGGKFRHLTTTLPLPGEGDFYTAEEAAERPPGKLIEGLWKLPRTGTTIVIRPPNEEAADYLPESEMSGESFFFELAWDGAEFTSVKLPRLIPPFPHEPKECVFQCESPTSGLLYLQRRGTQVKGELRQLGRTLAVAGEIEPEGPEITVTLDGEEATPFQLSQGGAAPYDWDSVTLATDLNTEEEYLFETLPADTDAPPLPRASIQGKEEVRYPQFEAKGSDWKAVNEKIAALVAAEQKAFAEAPKTTTADDPAYLSISFEITGWRKETLSVLLEVVRYIGGPHGQGLYLPVNYDFKNQRFLELKDLFREDKDWTTALAGFLNAALVEDGLQEEGGTLVLPETVGHIPWTFGTPHDVVFHIAMESLTPASPEATVTIPFQSLFDAELIRTGGPLDSTPE